MFGRARPLGPPRTAQRAVRTNNLPQQEHGCSVARMADCHFFMPAPTKIWIIVAFAALYLIWGSTYLGIRFAIETIPPFLMAGTRFLVAGVIMYAIAWSQGIGKSTWRNWRTSLIIGACLLLGGNGGVTMSEKYIDSGLAALIYVFLPTTDGILRLECRSCLSRLSSGRRDPSIRAPQNTWPLHFSPPPNRCSAADCFSCSLAS
ncbi:MAG: hypothetical protein DME87_00130 [Verrucomicrobia bacterium]|nr:MAG: hypothetical protein DME87_00130 [Verrucomicrobiota bacterium]